MSTDRQHLELTVANLDCEHDAAKLRRTLADESGVSAIDVRAASGAVAVAFDGALTSAEAIRGRLADAGFPPRASRGPARPPPPWRNAKVVTSLSSGLLLLAGWMLALGGVPATASTTAYAVSIVVGGYFFGREAAEELLFERRVGIELLMAVAAIIAAVMGAPGEGAMLVFLYSISEAAEGYTADKTRSAIRALMDLTPKRVVVRRDGVEREIPVESIFVGDLFIVRPGGSIATDGEVVSGKSAVNEAPVTGESVPVDRGPGEDVLAGTINGGGALEVRATKPFAANTLSHIIRMVEEAQERKGRNQRFIERFGRRYSPVVLAVGVLVAIVPPALFGVAWVEWITRATVFIVAAAPCALVISIPITLVATLGTGARNGVLIKGGIHVEQLANIRVVAFDKTGTLTRGEPEVTDVVPLSSERGAPRTEEDVLAVAAGIEHWSEHPLARAIVRAAAGRGIEPRDARDFQAVVGAGASARVGEETVFVGSPSYFREELQADLAEFDAQIESLQAEGKTVILTGTRGCPRGLVALRDNLRPEARGAIAELRRAGIERIVMLSGDNDTTAQAIGAAAGVDQAHGHLKPEDKVRLVEDLARSHGHVAMVGDGVNDAPALATARVGIAMGTAGTDVALETADVALMADNLNKLVYALRLARRSDRVVRQNLVLSVIVIATLVVGAILGVLTLPIAVVAHEVSEFLVIGNGLRMLRS